MEPDKLLDWAAGIAASIFAWAGVTMWNRQNNLELALKEQTRELRASVEKQGQVAREEHARLRATVESNHATLVKIIIDNSKGH